MSRNVISEQSIVCPAQGVSGRAIRRRLPRGSASALTHVQRREPPLTSRLSPRCPPALRSRWDPPQGADGGSQFRGAVEHPSLHARAEADPGGGFGVQRGPAERGVTAQSPPALLGIGCCPQCLQSQESSLLAELCPWPAAETAHLCQHHLLAWDVHQRAQPWVGSPANSYQALEPKWQRRAKGSLPSLLLSLHQLLPTSVSQIRCEQTGVARSAGSAARSPEHKL